MAAKAKSKVLEVHRLGAASVAGRWAGGLRAKRSPAGEGWALGSKVWSGSVVVPALHVLHVPLVFVPMLIGAHHASTVSEECIFNGFDLGGMLALP